MPDGQTEAARRTRTGDGIVRRRIAAFLIDTALVVGACGAAASKTVSARTHRVVVTGLLASTLGFLYHVALEGAYGQTAGKHACGVAVVTVDGRPVSYGAATLRTAGRLVDALPLGYLVGLAAMAVTPRHQRVGDLLAGTVVVSVDERADDP